MPKYDTSVYLIGDYALVKEWSSKLHDHCFRTFARVTSKTQNNKLPKYCEKIGKRFSAIQYAFDLTILNRNIKKENVQYLDDKLPKEIPIFTSSVTVSTTEQASWIRRPERLLGISAFPTFTNNKLIEIAPSIHTSKSTITCSEDIFIRLDKEIAVVQDRVGMVMPRIICSVINEAFFASTEGIAGAKDIDLAMKLGTNYPIGPIEWANLIGLDYVIAVLEALHTDTGDTRYRIAPLLRQLSLGKKWWAG